MSSLTQCLRQSQCELDPRSFTLLAFFRKSPKSFYQESGPSSKHPPSPTAFGPEQAPRCRPTLSARHPAQLSQEVHQHEQAQDLRGNMLPGDTHSQLLGGLGDTSSRCDSEAKGDSSRHDKAGVHPNLRDRRILLPGFLQCQTPGPEKAIMSFH